MVDHHNPAKTDRRLNLLLTAVVLVTAATLVLAAVTAPSTITGANNSDAVKQGNELQSCRSEYRTKTVDEALTVLDAARDDLALLTNEIVQSAIDLDGRLVDLVLTAPARRQALTDAKEGRRAATDAYSAAVVRSREDTDGFLTDCRHGFPGG